MWALLAIVGSIVAGWQVVRQLPLQMRRTEALAASVAIGFNLVSWLVFMAAWAFGFAIGLPLALFLATAMTAASQRYLKPQVIITEQPYSKRYRWLTMILALTSLYIVGNLVVLSYQFPADNGSWISNGNVWGDGPLHVGLITHFAGGNKIDLVSPIYQKIPLSYPFIGDFYSSVLMRLGGSWQLSLMIVSLIMTASLMMLIFSFGYRLLGSVRAAWLQFLLLLLSGSTHAGYVLSKVLLTQGYAAYVALIGTSIPFATGDNYLNFFHSHPLPQRSYLFGMPIFIIVAMVALELYRGKALAGKPKLAQRSGLIVGALAGLLPLIHTHSFLVLASLLGLAAAGMLIKSRKLVVGWLQMLITMAVVALPQLVYQFSTSYDSHFNSSISGWMMQNFSPLEHANWFEFWLMQLGALFIFMLLGWYFLRRYKARAEIWLAYIAGLLIFAICNVHVFQPSEWDNMKFFEYAFWFIMLATAWIMTKWLRPWYGKLAVGAIMLSLTIMGFYTLVLSGPKITFELLSASEVSFGESMNKTLPADAYILVSDRHNHPITMLAGRKVLMTYAGWYNLYHANWPTVSADRSTMLLGGVGAENLIRSYGLTHVVFSDYEVANGQANLEFYKQHYALFTNQDGWWVFNLKQPL